MKKERPVWQICLLVSAILFVFLFLFGYRETIGILIAISIVVFVDLFLYPYIYYERQDNKGQFKITNWKWLPFITGFTGFPIIIFWILLLLRFARLKNTKRKFSDMIRFPIFMYGILVILIILTVFLLWYTADFFE